MMSINTINQLKKTTIIDLYDFSKQAAITNRIRINFISDRPGLQKNNKKLNRLEDKIFSAINNQDDPISFIFENKKLLKNIKKWLKLRTTKKRYKHLKSSAKWAKKFAKLLDQDKKTINTAYFSSLVHDCAKHFDFKKVNYELLLKQNGINILSHEKKHGPDYHAHIGALCVKNNLGINDGDVFRSVRNHSFFYKKSPLIDQIIVLADKVEPYLRQKEFSQIALKALNKKQDINYAMKMVNKAFKKIKK